MSSWFQSLSATVSAAWVENSEVRLGFSGVDEKELIAMIDFWRRIRVLRRASNVERCCFTAFPLATSAFVAAEMVAITDFWDSAIILRRAARSSKRTSASSGELLELSSVSPLFSEKFSSLSVTESPSVTEDSRSSVVSSAFLTAFRIELIFSSCSDCSSSSLAFLSSSLTSSSVSLSRSTSLLLWSCSFTTCSFESPSKLNDSPSSEPVNSSSPSPSEKPSPLRLRSSRLTSEP